MATLFIASGPDEGRWFPLGKRTTVVGRDEGLIGQVLGEGISRKHLQVQFDPASGDYIATDMASKNGVFVNGVRIKEPIRLQNLDLLRIGERLLLFTTEEARDEQDNALLYNRKRGERMKMTQQERLTDV